MSRILWVDPGASYATGDVSRGFVDALRAQGHDLGVYNLSTRIDLAGKWLNYVWKQAKKPPDEKPAAADVLWVAGCDVVTRALRHEPDFVAISSCMYLHPDILVLLRRARQRTVLLLSESPYDDVQQAKVIPYADLVFTNERSSVLPLRAVNPNTHYLPHAYDPTRHMPDTYADPELPAHDVVFVGSGFEERVELLSKVDWSGIDLGLYGYWDLLGSRHPLRKFVRGKIIDNVTAAALYRKARIGLNLYRSSVGFGRNVPKIHGAESLNPRAYELAACGVFQISDCRSEVTEIFDGAVPTFGTPAELGALIRASLADDERRTRAAERARRLILPHTYVERASRLVEHLERLREAA